jgi:hypothetical protein
MAASMSAHVRLSYATQKRLDPLPRYTFAVTWEAWLPLLCWQAPAHVRDGRRRQ